MLDVESWRSRRALTLLKYLAARCGERVPRDALVGLLWPENDDGERSTHNLHTLIYYLRHLRRTLEPNLGPYETSRFLRQTHGMYWLDKSAPVWCDTDEFLRLIRQAEALRGKNDAQALGLYQRALALYRDDFCPEDVYDDWTVTMREKFRELVFGATLQAAYLLAKVKRDYDGAVNLCRAALAREPYREELHRAVISHLILSGRYGEAALQYRTCERLLQEEFGLSPSPATQAVFEAMKRSGDRRPLAQAE